MPAIRPRGRAGRRMPRYPLCTGKHKRGCTGSNGIPSSVVPSKRRFGAAPTAGISIGGASAARGTLQSPAGRPRRPPNRRSTAPKPVLYTLRNRFPAQTRPSLYARAQRQAARRHCKDNENCCASRKLFHRFAVRLAVGRRLYNDFPVLSSTGALLIKSYPVALFRGTA